MKVSTTYRQVVARVTVELEKDEADELLKALSWLEYVREHYLGSTYGLSCFGVARDLRLHIERSL